jgi:SAM-dependent methyltransferase
MLGSVHERLVYGRRIRVLARHLAELLPAGAKVLDVGAGDGLLASRVRALRPDLDVQGVDVLVRAETHIPVERFDGTTLPYADDAFDAIMMVDVLHHATEQDRLLAEISRVASRCVVIKDHFVRGVLAEPTLKLMDWVGNARHGVSLPYAYWTPSRWSEAFERAGLRVLEQRDAVGLYPWPASLLFDRGLHFIARLEPAPVGQVR